MTVIKEIYGTFEKNIQHAIKALKVKDYIAAQEYIKYAMVENCHAPDAHNLLGAVAEITGDLILADKHYRAAYALDPTYKAATRNLERITSFYYKIGSENPDLGDKPEKEESNPYIIEYDSNNVGHLTKGGK